MRSVQLKNVTLGDGVTKVIVPITGRTTGELVSQASALGAYALDIVEWRVDFHDEALEVAVVLDAARQIVDALAGRPLLFTFRTAAEGGKPIAPDAYAALNIAAIESGLVDAVDVEQYFDEASGDRVLAATRAAGVVVFGSNHDFEGTPPTDEIVRRLLAMQARGMDVAKIAVMPRDPEDVLRLLTATFTMASEHPQTPVLTMAMAGLGVVTRLAGQVFGSCATFAMVGTASAPGQVPVPDLQPVLKLIAGNTPPLRRRGIVQD